MFKRGIQSAKSAVSAIRKLEGVGTTTMHRARTMQYSGNAMRKAAAPFVGSAGRTMNAVGRHPKTAIGIGVGTVGAISASSRSNNGFRGLKMNNMTRQNTMYNQKMRSGSSGVGGLLPKSMGGYA